MRSSFRFIVVALFLVSFASCAAINPQVRMEPGDDACLLFGYIDMAGSGDTLEKVVLTQDEKSGVIYRQSPMNTYSDGLFFMQDLPPMSYAIPRFYAGGNLYNLPHEDDNALVLEPGSFTYLGAWKYQGLKKEGVLSPKRFELLVTDTPGEGEVLKLLRERVEGDKWKRVIDARLKELGK